MNDADEWDHGYVAPGPYPPVVLIVFNTIDNLWARIVALETKLAEMQIVRIDLLATIRSIAKMVSVIDAHKPLGDVQ